MGKSRIGNSRQHRRPACLIEALEDRRLLSAQLGAVEDGLPAVAPRQAGVELAAEAETSAVEATISLETSASTVMSGENVTLTATVTPTDAATPLPAAKVAFIRLDGHGSLRYTDPASGSTSYCWLLGTADVAAQGKATLTAAASGPERVWVQQRALGYISGLPTWSTTRRTLENPGTLPAGQDPVVAVLLGDSAILADCDGSVTTEVPGKQAGLKTAVSSTTPVLVRTAASLNLCSWGTATKTHAPTFGVSFVQDGKLCGTSGPQAVFTGAIQSATAQLGVTVPLPPPPPGTSSGSSGSATITGAGSRWWSGDGSGLDMGHMEYSGPTPTGTVRFYDGETLWGSVSLGGGVAVFVPASLLSLGAHTITAVYEGDDVFATATASMNISVERVKTSMSVSTSSYSVPQGQSMKWTATVSTQSADFVVPSGTVTFKEGETILGTVALGETDENVTLDLALGTHTIAAYYSGDDNVETCASQSFWQTIIPAAQNPTGQNPTGQSKPEQTRISYTPAPTGQFPTVFTQQRSPVKVKLAQVAAATKARGAMLVARIIGTDDTSSGNSGVSTQPALTTPGTPATIRFRLGRGQVPQNPVVYQNLTYYQSLVGTLSCYTLGTVSFYNGSQLVGTAPVSSDGTAALPSAKLPKGRYELRAVYGGDSTHASGESNTLPVVVGKAKTMTELTFTQGAKSRSLVMALSVRAADTDTVVPGGLVTLRAGRKVIGRYRLGRVSKPIVLRLGPGTHQLRATYEGDSNCARSISVVKEVTID